MEITDIEGSDVAAILSLWKRSNLLRAGNDPRADIDRARRARDATILVGRRESAVVATAMAGFDGHRGWVYYLAVEPGCSGRASARRS
jgi:hypothetical protein